ncbi:uncharacterized protein N7483_004193 [Penicillium malachiteum]|uniref:uncharacterized protein n=1 Tax=Penicillium malachiteum TaxID=1324776 RepID=UPI0025470171|nr:uncharacterized protein N7483_004193 [Penicillium malachiteum]KAJ5729685.1 hypothetical protein N7483_004193 [Penicillium malachiteum]
MITLALTWPLFTPALNCPFQPLATLVIPGRNHASEPIVAATAPTHSLSLVRSRRSLVTLEILDLSALLLCPTSNSLTATLSTLSRLTATRAVLHLALLLALDKSTISSPDSILLLVNTRRPSRDTSNLANHNTNSRLSLKTTAVVEIRDVSLAAWPFCAAASSVRRVANAALIASSAASSAKRHDQ